MSINNGYAQYFGGFVLNNESVFAHAPSLESFIMLFNGSIHDTSINDQGDSNYKTTTMLHLFDWNQFQSGDSSDTMLIKTFVDYVNLNDYKLDMHCSELFAEAQCVFYYDQEEVPLNILLHYENIKDGYYKWSVVGANGLTVLGMIDTIRNGYINPVQNELHFSELSSACVSDLTRYLSSDLSIDQLSFVLGLLKSGKLRYQSCNNVQYHFLQIPNYVLVVRKVNRLGLNSGYLINSLFQLDDAIKPEYINQLLGEK